MRKQLRLQTMRGTPRISRIHLPGSGAALPGYSLTDTTPGPRRRRLVSHQNGPGQQPRPQRRPNRLIWLAADLPLTDAMNLQAGLPACFPVPAECSSSACSSPANETPRPKRPGPRSSSGHSGGGHANTAAVGAKCRNLSQLSHELTGRYETVAHLPDNRQDADLRSGFWRTDRTGGIGLRIRCPHGRWW
jgi:hypothetical protein